MKLYRTVFALAVLTLWTQAAVVNAAILRVQPAPSSLGSAQIVTHRYFGVLCSARGSTLVLGLRNGRSINVDASAAFALGRVSGPLFIGKALVVTGTFASGSVFTATIVQRTVPRAAGWDIDR